MLICRLIILFWFITGRFTCFNAQKTSAALFPLRRSVLAPVSKLKLADSNKLFR